MGFQQQALFEDTIIFPDGLIFVDAQEVELLSRLLDECLPTERQGFGQEPATRQQWSPNNGDRSHPMAKVSRPKP